jgi:hypothetical protein
MRQFGTARLFAGAHPTAITVPYASMTDHIRRNCGFVDLRGRPDKAKDIAEASDSPALQQLLVHVAKQGRRDGRQSFGYVRLAVPFETFPPTTRPLDLPQSGFVQSLPS